MFHLVLNGVSIGLRLKSSIVRSVEGQADGESPHAVAATSTVAGTFVVRRSGGVSVSLVRHVDQGRNDIRVVVLRFDTMADVGWDRVVVDFSTAHVIRKKKVFKSNI